MMIFERNSLKIRLIANLSVVIFLMFIVSGYITYRLHMNITIDEVSQQFELNTEQVMHHIDVQVQRSYRLTNQIIYHPIIMNVLQESRQSIKASSFEEDTIKQAFDVAMIQDSKILSIHIFDSVDHQYKPTNTFLSQEIKPEFYLKVKNNLQSYDLEWTWDRVTLDQIYVNASPSSRAIVASRWVINKKQEISGVLIMILEESYFSGELRVYNAYDGNVFIFNDDGLLLYATGPNEWSEAMPLGIPNDLTGMHEIDGVTYLMSQSQSNDETLGLISIASMDSLNKRSLIILKVAAIGGFVSIVLCVFLVMLITSRLFIPLEKLINSLKRIGTVDTDVYNKTNDEVKYISETLDLLITEVYEKQLSEREAELQMLQAQLNPHFLYNTLDMIYWKLYIKDDYDNARLIVSLSEILRYSLDPIENETSFADEMHQISNYLNIQKTRYEKSLEVCIEIDNDVMDASIIRLLIQPLIENIFVHAFQNKQEDKILGIRAKKSAAQVVIDITDNGCGMSPDIIESLKNCGSDKGKQLGSIGFSSVMRRLNLIYGSSSRLEVFSKEGCGTALKLVLPYKKYIENQSRIDSFQIKEIGQ